MGFPIFAATMPLVNWYLCHWRHVYWGPCGPHFVIREAEFCTKQYRLRQVPTSKVLDQKYLNEPLNL